MKALVWWVMAGWVLVQGCATPAAQIRWERINTTGNVDLRSGATELSLSIGGKIEPAPDDVVLAVARSPIIEEAIDDEGTSLVGGGVHRPDIVAAFKAADPEQKFGPDDFNMVRGTDLPAMSITLGRLSRMPRRITRLRGRTHLLLAHEVRTVKLEDAATGHYLETPHGFEVKLEVRDTRRPQADPPPPREQPIQVRVHVQARRQIDVGSRWAAMWQPPLIRSVSLLDAQGRTIECRIDGPRQQFDNTGSGQLIGFEGYATLAPDQEVAAMVLNVVTKTRIAAVPFDLADIPLP